MSPPRLARIVLPIVAATLAAPSATSAQSYDSHFHTGNAVVDLRTVPPSVTCPVGIAGFEGTSTWSDPSSGDLRFFTDGISVFDASTGAAVAGGAGTLGGNPTATQTSFLAPVPGTLNAQLYIFSNDTDNVRLNVLDDSGPAPVVTIAGSLFLSDTGEAVSGLDDEAGGFWLVVWNEAGATLDAYSVTDLGIASTPVSSPLPWSNLYSSRGTIVFPRDGSKVAVTTEGGPGLAWATFDRETATVTSSWTTVHSRQGYSVAWSPDGTQLYYVAGSSYGWMGSLYQYDTGSGVETLLGGSGLSGVMLGADDSIWVCGYAAPTLGQVTNPNVGGVSNTQLAALSLGGCTAGYNLSNQVSLTDVLCLDLDGDTQAPARCGGEDCNDAAPETYTGAPELCDGVDNDCDLVLDPDELDQDGDTFMPCAGDCDDANEGTWPGAPEVCDGQDNDCDGVVPLKEADEDGNGQPDCDDQGDDDSADDDDSASQGDDDTVDDADNADDDTEEDDPRRRGGCDCDAGSGGTEADLGVLALVGLGACARRRSRRRARGGQREAVDSPP